MFTVQFLRQNAAGETVHVTREGVVDVKTFPAMGKASIEFNGDRDDETLPITADTTISVTSPLK